MKTLLDLFKSCNCTDCQAVIALYRAARAIDADGPYPDPALLPILSDTLVPFDQAPADHHGNDVSPPMTPAETSKAAKGVVKAIDRTVRASRDRPLDSDTRPEVLAAFLQNMGKARKNVHLVVEFGEGDLRQLVLCRDAGGTPLLLVVDRDADEGQYLLSALPSWTELEMLKDALETLLALHKLQTEDTDRPASAELDVELDS